MPPLVLWLTVATATAAAAEPLAPPLGLRAEHAPSPVLGVDPEAPVRLAPPR
jgi:hypothetical protein